MKTYVITLSKVFPKGHPKQGEPTHFREAFRTKKLHTIRANFPLWKKRITEVQEGKACLSVRQWTGAPYRSKQEEIARLTAQDGVKVQMVKFRGNDLADPRLAAKWHLNPKTLAANDGLTFEDWQEWFKDYDRSQPLAIIQFTDFYYGGLSKTNN